MKKEVLKILVCPSCKSGLDLTAFSREGKGGEIVNGLLSCKGCKRWYPVIKGIPRMLPADMINKTLLAEFMNRYERKLPKLSDSVGAEINSLKMRTSASFGFQWNVFSEIVKVYKKNFMNYIEPLKPSFFKGKLVLDAGCGFGRHTYYAAEFGATVVGFDLSDAVDAAYRNCRKFDKVHIVQGDIYNLPFRKKFDFIMSIGVLHHLPYPKKGFMKLVDLMRSDSSIFAWLYGREGRWFKLHVVEGIIRKVTTRMPHRMLYYFCYLPAAVYHTTNAFYNFMSNRRGLDAIARRLPFKGYARMSFMVKHADAFDLLGTPVNNYYMRQEVERWGKDAKLRNVRVTSLEGKSWRLFGDK